MRRGAYGISINGIPGLDELLVESEPSWPSIRLEVDLERGSHANEFVDDRNAALNLKTGGRLTVDRSEGLARFATGRPLSNDELIHPFMAPVAAIVAHWERRVAFHAGAIAIDGAAWGVLGTREAGKSSLLAWLSSHNGIDIVADDVLVLLDGHVFSGPRTIDLREPSAERLGGEAMALPAPVRAGVCDCHRSLRPCRFVAGSCLRGATRSGSTSCPPGSDFHSS